MEEVRKKIFVSDVTQISAVDCEWSQRKFLEVVQQISPNHGDKHFCSMWEVLWEKMPKEIFQTNQVFVENDLPGNYI